MLIRRLRYWLRSRKRAAALREEMELHLTEKAAELREAGLDEAAARAEARRRFGNVVRAAEEARTVWGAMWWGQLRQDVRYALRTMGSNKGFTVLAILCLALGIGANTTIFSVMESVMFRSLPVEDPDSLIVLRWRVSEIPTADSSPIHLVRGVLTEDDAGPASDVWPYLAFDLFREEEGVFAGVFGFQPVSGVSFDDGVGPLVDGDYVTGEYFQTLGIRAAAGRLLGEDDDRIDAPPAVVLTAAFAAGHFGAPQSAVGQSIRLNNVSFTVVGVTPPEFFGIDPGRSPGFFIPVRTGPLLQRPGVAGSNSEMYQNPRDYWIRVAGRLRSGVSLPEAEAVLAQRFEQFVYGLITTDEQRRAVPTLVAHAGGGGLDTLRLRYGAALQILFGMVALILAIACANIASLLMSRAVMRRREMAIRLSIGAGRGRVIRQLLTESMLLASAGGLVGVGMSFWGVQLLTGLLAGGEDAALRAQLNGQVLAFTALLSIVTGVMFGLAPAMQATRVDLAPTLKGSRSDGAAGRGRLLGFHRLGQLLVAAQIALSLLLLVGAGLLAGTLSNLRTAELGFNKDGLLLATIVPRSVGPSAEALKSFYGRLRSRLREVPGVDEVSMSWSALAGGGVYVVPVSVPGGMRAEANLQVIGETFFSTMQIPILLGHAITDQEVESRSAVAVVDQRFADAFFPGLDPLGRTIDVEWEGELEIVGVAANARHDVIRSDVRPVVYYTYLWDPHALPSMVFELRTGGDPMRYAAALRESVREVDPDAAVASVRTQVSNIDRTMSQEITLTRLGGGFAVLALLIASVGLYGTVTHSTNRRVHEIGIRMALGATRGAVLRLVLGEALALGLAGIVIGLPASMAASPLIENFLWGIEPGDITTVAVAVGVLLLAVLLAAYAPAWRASRIDPKTALQSE